MAGSDTTCWTVIRGAAQGRVEDREAFARRYLPAGEESSGSPLRVRNTAVRYVRRNAVQGSEVAAKTERIEVRLTPEHKAVLENAAALRGQSLSAFVVSEALEQARRLQLTILTRGDWELFREIMDREEEPTPALGAAARKQRRGS